MKKIVKFLLGFFCQPILTLSTIADIRRPSKSHYQESLDLAANWLLKSQNQKRRSGYSRKYSLINGWDKPYIETTGYIIPSMHCSGILLNNQKFIESAKKASEWLIGIQNENGFYTDIDKKEPQVFDTGQVLIGLNFMFEKTSDPRFLDSIERACNWLISVQELNGSWVKYSYNARPHSYYTRVASALLLSGYILDNEKFKEAAKNNLNWALSQRKQNNFFRYSEFRDGEDSILHTIIYVLEGFSDAYKITKDTKWLDELRISANKLLSILNHDGLLFSQYSSDWEVTNYEYCVTGLAQLAGIFYDLANFDESQEFFNAADRVMVRLYQYQCTNKNILQGAFPSSIPIWGYYGGMDFYNWNSKFFIDASIKRLILTSNCPDEVRSYYFRDLSISDRFRK